MKIRIISKIGLALAAILSSLVLFEILLRLATREPENLAKLRSSSLFLYENKPNATFPYDREGEYQNQITINSYGFRDDEFNVEKGEGVWRIAVLGDSQEEALQVELEDTWQKVMAGKLSEELKVTLRQAQAIGSEVAQVVQTLMSLQTQRARRGDTEQSRSIKVESYNFGVSGYGTDQQWLTLREKVWNFTPDMVILAFSPNDVGDTYKNQLVRIVDGKIEVASHGERVGGNLLGRMVRETYIYHFLAKVASANRFTKSVVSTIRTEVLGFASDERFFLSDAQLAQGPFEVIASQENPPEEVSETWEVVRALIADMKRQAEERGVQFLITVNIPRTQVRWHDWDQLRNLYKLDPTTSSAYEINEVVSRMAFDLGINIHDPREEAIEWREEKGDLHYEGDAHFNENGHLFMGTKVAEFILANELIK